MPVDLITNINTGKTIENQNINDASATTKTAGSNPVIGNQGITGVSNAENDLITTLSGTPKPSLRQPEIPVGGLIGQTLTLAPEIAKMLNLTAQPTLGEFITACTGKLTDDIGKTALDAATGEAGGTRGKFDSEVLDCMILLLTMGSKSNLLQTLKETLQAKIKDRTTANQKLIDKNVESAKKNVEGIEKQKETEAKRKLWGILDAVFSIAAAIVSAAVTVALCGATAPLGVLAIAGCVATCIGSACTIGGLAGGNETAQKIGMWFGIAGGVLSLASGIGSIWAADKHVNNLLRIMATVAGAVSGVTSSTGQIGNGFAQKELAGIEKELANVKISLDKLQQQIDLLSDMLDKVADSIKNFMKDLFQDEEEVAQMVQQMMNTNLSIEQNVKC